MRRYRVVKVWENDYEVQGSFLWWWRTVYEYSDVRCRVAFQGKDAAVGWIEIELRRQAEAEHRRRFPKIVVWP